MAIQRLNLTQIRTEILRIVGNYADSTKADWRTDSNLYRIVNLYGQQLGIRSAMAARDNLPPGVKRLCFDMYKTHVESTASASDTGLVISAGEPRPVYLPVDYDHHISFYDLTNSRPIDVVTDVTKRHLNLKKLTAYTPSGAGLTPFAGPPEAIEILHYITISSTWRRTAILYPNLGVSTVVIELYYYRLPAIMAGTDPDNEYVDADPKYQYLWIYGPVCELTRPNSPTYDRYKSLETDLLVDLAATGKEY